MNSRGFCFFGDEFGALDRAITHGVQELFESLIDVFDELLNA
jgi:hypothetical protein